jgi:FixJ family two-component response regulator
MAVRPIVSVVDDDESVRESLPDLLAELGFRARAFASAEEFLESGAVGDTRCLILDITMPGMSGPELYRELLARGHAVPTVFISAHVNENMRANLMKQGAVACLFKPFTEKELGIALQAAVGAP